MRRIIILILVLLVTILSFSQKTALVTDIRYVLQFFSYDTEPEKEFPNYFNDNEFTGEILNLVDSLIKEKLDVQEVKFYQQQPIQYIQDEFTGRLNIKTISKTNAVYFVTIVNFLRIKLKTTTFKEYTSQERIVYELKTKLNITDKEGKKVFKQKASIPFETIRGNEISGKVKIGKTDFQNLYIESLIASFDEEGQNFDKRIIYRPSIDVYDSFTNNTSKYLIDKSRKTISLIDYENNRFQVLNYKRNNWRNFDFGEWLIDFIPFLNDYSLNSGFNVNNTLLDKEYFIEISGGETVLLDFFSFMEDIKITIFENKDTIGKFNLVDYGNINGSIDLIDFKTNRVNDIDLTKYYTDDELFALTQEISGNELILYIDEELDFNEKGYFLNVFVSLDLVMKILWDMERERDYDEEPASY